MAVKTFARMSQKKCTFSLQPENARKQRSFKQSTEFQLILFSNIHVPRMYPISLFFVHLLGIIDTLQQSAKAKTAGILISVSHTPFSISFLLTIFFLIV